MIHHFAGPAQSQRGGFDSISSHYRSHRLPYAHPVSSPLSTNVSYAGQSIEAAHRLSKQGYTMSPLRQEPISRISSQQRARRLPVTACDSCRIRKLKCNAKDLPEGSSCIQCSKQGGFCTFDDRKGLQHVVKARHSGSSLPPSLSGQQPNLYPRQPTSVIRNNTQRQQTLKESNVQVQSSNAHRSINGTDQRGTNGDHEGPRKMPATDNNQTWLRQGAGSTQSTHLQQGNPQRYDWDDWNIPAVVTDPDTGRSSLMKTQIVVELLVHRFYTLPSFNSIVVPNHSQFLRRMKHGDPSPVPSYLLHTIVACAAASSLTTERELQLWQAQVWHGATESVHARLNRTGPPELELVQALLLLSSNWPGSLLRVERINTFDTAVSLATSLQLHSGRHLDVAPGPRSNRIILFWALYCSDKIISVLTKRPPAIPTESHSIPLPSIAEISASNALGPKSTVAAWLQRLTFAYITLSQITESAQVHLLLPIQQGQITTLDQVFRKILPIEKKLEDFCKEQRWLLGSVSQLSPLCHNLADAVICQLHFTQLHLYFSSLQFEVDQKRSKNPSSKTSHHSSPSPSLFQFSSVNDKPLAATIESAWHLVQQPIKGTQASLSSIARHTSIPQSSSPYSLLDQNSGLSFSHACILVGMTFFKFLSTNWAEWDNGKGCLRYVPIRLSSPISQQQQQQQQESQSKERSDGTAKVEGSATLPSNDNSKHLTRSSMTGSDKASAHFVHASKSSLHFEIREQQKSAVTNCQEKSLILRVDGPTCARSTDSNKVESAPESTIKQKGAVEGEQDDGDKACNKDVDPLSSSSSSMSPPPSTQITSQDQEDSTSIEKMDDSDKENHNQSPEEHQTIVPTKANTHALLDSIQPNLLQVTQINERGQGGKGNHNVSVVITEEKLP